MIFFRRLLLRSGKEASVVVCDFTTPIPDSVEVREKMRVVFGLVEKAVVFKQRES